jgi:hypothetical protein
VAGVAVSVALGAASGVLLARAVEVAKDSGADGSFGVAVLTVVAGGVLARLGGAADGVGRVTPQPATTSATTTAATNRVGRSVNAATWRPIP